MYCAIIGDIVDSKKIKERDIVQSKLNEILEETNLKYTNDIEAKFLITIGDEFQGLLNNPSNLFNIINDIQFKFLPYKLRIGIGIGDMSTNIIKKHAIGSDGPAYYAARECIDEIKSNKNKYEKPYEYIKIKQYDLEENPSYMLLNSTLSLLGYLSKDWTMKQSEVIKYMYFDDLSQREIGKKLDLEQSSVQRRITSSGYVTYRNAVENSQVFINKIWESLNV